MKSYVFWVILPQCSQLEANCWCLLHAAFLAYSSTLNKESTIPRKHQLNFFQQTIFCCVREDIISSIKLSIIILFWVSLLFLRSRNGIVESWVCFSLHNGFTHFRWLDNRWETLSCNEHLWDSNILCWKFEVQLHIWEEYVLVALQRYEQAHRLQSPACCN
jgi:hypothetical protein